MTDKPVGQQLGPWRLQIAPGWNRPEIAEALTQLRFLLERAQAPLLAPPGRNQVHRLQLPCGDSSAEVVVKTYGVQSPWRDRRAQLIGSKAERAFRNALLLRNAGVGTPAPIGIAEHWEGTRLRESHFVAAFIPQLTNLRDELNRIYAEAPYCAPLMTLLQCVANQTRAMHDAGLLHGDLGNQNIALQPHPETPDAPWNVYFLDLNRARQTPSPTPAQRGADLARLDLPSDFRRVFHAMYFHGYAPPPEFATAEAKTRAAFARHTALRPFRHPLREARIRRAQTREEQPLRGRDIWIWDDRSAQAIPAYTSRDRRQLQPASNVGLALRSAAKHGCSIRRNYKRLLAQSFQTPVAMNDAIGIALEPEPTSWARQLDFLSQLQGPQKIPLLLRLYHHKNLESWQWTLDQALLLHRQGHGIAIALVQDRRAIREPKGWRQMVALAFDRAHSFADFFEIGHAVNRSKWGVWDFREYLDLLQPVRAALIEYPNAKITGPACIDFEPHALGALLDILPRDLPFHALSQHLYVDRRGAPENAQGPFDTVGKCALLRAAARTFGMADDRLIISEVNWPILGAGVWSPVNSPYETLDPRQNDPSVDEETYAAYLSRYLLLTLASGHASRAYWWRLAARGFGLVDDTHPTDWRPRPAFYALQELLARLNGATFTRKPQTPPGEYALEFATPAGPLTARWTATTAPVFS